MDSTIGNKCLRVVREAAQRHGKDVLIADMYAVPTWTVRPSKGSTPKGCSSLPSLDKLQWTRALPSMCFGDEE
ncbi:hypothetical protein SKAU_G00018980 [Synaphobranchus kaupii]|uniref:Uncharacterized protein n=1 Tax=Synaphobranchus kaupii TaxID=118154 RepID=A0A9Q1JDP6_SYNKA|nr:hypothetical protein SKAU_G00018980 [Synaphobranchus kaupii]